MGIGLRLGGGTNYTSCHRNILRNYNYVCCAVRVCQLQGHFCVVCSISVYPVLPGNSAGNLYECAAKKTQIFNHRIYELYLFLETKVSRGSVIRHLRCGGIFSAESAGERILKIR